MNHAAVRGRAEPRGIVLLEHADEVDVVFLPRGYAHISKRIFGVVRLAFVRDKVQENPFDDVRVRVFERTKEGFKIHLERVQDASEQHFREDVRSRLEAYEHSLRLLCCVTSLEDPSVKPVEVDRFPRIAVKLGRG